jgi:hypothetical protein
MRQGNSALNSKYFGFQGTDARDNSGCEGYKTVAASYRHDLGSLESRLEYHALAYSGFAKA